MTLGILGDVVFQVTEETVKTLNNLRWSGSARWAVHERHGGDALTEFTGREPDEISFDIYLSAFLGVNPMEDIVRLWNYEREGTPIPFMLGEHKYGKLRWVIQDHTTTPESYDGEGDITSCTVTVKLLEYLKE